MIKIDSLNKIYKSKKRKQHHALRDVNITFPNAGLVFVTGKSGSGKTTLLNLIGGLDKITSGRIVVDGNDVSSLSESSYANYRNSHIGFIFQDYHLIDALTVAENIRLALDLRRIDDEKSITIALSRVGLEGYETRFPTELSGGERQRVAIARAIVKNPRIILADEPTGNLDNKTATQIIKILKDLSKDCLVLIVSHNTNDAHAYADRIIELSGGKIISDTSKNPDFPTELTLQNGKIVYPDGRNLTEKEIAILNENKGVEIVKRTDKFILTEQKSEKDTMLKIQKNSPKIKKTMAISGKFLKNKTVAISLSSFMVAVIMVIMALAQTIIVFDAGRILQEEMDKNKIETIFASKRLNDEQKIVVSEMQGISGDTHAEILSSDIECFKTTGYNGKIYEILNINLLITGNSMFQGRTDSALGKSLYLNESFGTALVSDEFITEMFGEDPFIILADEAHPTGFYITDYLADALIYTSPHKIYLNKTYEDLLGYIYYPNGGAYGVEGARCYVNGIINTGYKDRFADIIESFKKGQIKSYTDLSENEKFLEFSNELYSKLGYCYSTNPNFKEDMKTNPAWDYVFLGRLYVNGGLYETNVGGLPSRVMRAAVTDVDLEPNQVIMSYKYYNNAFDTNFHSANLDTFVPHTAKFTGYRLYDTNNSVYDVEIEIVAIVEESPSQLVGCLLAGESVYQEISSAYIYTRGLLFHGDEGLDKVMELFEEENYVQKSITMSAIHTMTRAVDVFVPIFELIAIFLCLGVVFILVNFSSKMIKDKMHEIGILKALGTKNGTVAIVFGLQVLLIAVFTCILASVGYYFFIDLTNDVLIKSLIRLAPGSVVLDLNFLQFNPKIAVMNCILVFILASISLIAPILKIHRIEPVKIIKSKE